MVSSVWVGRCSQRFNAIHNSGSGRNIFVSVLHCSAALQSISIIDKGQKITDKLEKAGQELKPCIYDSQVKVVSDPDGQFSDDSAADSRLIAWID